MTVIIACALRAALEGNDPSHPGLTTSGYRYQAEMNLTTRINLHDLLALYTPNSGLLLSFSRMRQHWQLID
jgi:hypothetical protein